MALIDRDGTRMHTAPDLAFAANRVRGEFGLPDVILEAGSLVHAAPREGIRNGDSANDVQAAQAASDSAARFETGYSEGESVHDLAGALGVGGIFPGLFEAAHWVIRTVLASMPAREDAALPPRYALP